MPLNVGDVDNLPELLEWWFLIKSGMSESELRKLTGKPSRVQKLYALYLLHEALYPALNVYDLLFFKQAFYFGPLEAKKLRRARWDGLSAVQTYDGLLDGRFKLNQPEE